MFVVERDGRVLAMAWVCLHQRRESVVGIVFHLGLSGAWVYDGYTAPEARRRGYYALLLHRVDEYVRGHGCTKTYALVTSDDEMFLKAHSRFGYEVIGELVYSRIGLFHGC